MKTRFIIPACAAALLSTSALAAGLEDAAKDTMHEAKDIVAGKSISQLPGAGEVTISGTVTHIDKVDNEFTLKDSSGQIDVESDKKLTVNVGDQVVVSGLITEDMGEKEIAANQITVSETAAERSQN